ncbi:MAG: TIGR03545 family protein [Deltaproteobacteria bacterium]|nr:TIGR03545 family protein [Deltaproteobacteria bacterium]
MIIRLKVFIPVVLVIATTLIISFFFIDFWVKNWIENGISAVTGTKTDIRDLKLSFKNSSLKIRRLEIASKEKEFENFVEFEDVVVDFQTLPLLKKRFVIDEFSIEGIMWATPRRTSGKLLFQKKVDEQPSWISDLKNEAFESVKNEFEKMPISKLSEFRIPNDPREIVSSLDLKSTDAYKTVIEHAQELKTKWPERFKEIKNTSELEAKFKEAKALVENVPQNPQEILKRIEGIKSVIEFFQSEQKRVEGIIHDVKTDSAKIQADYDLATQALNDDFNRAKKLVSLDELNVGNISRILFGPEWLQKIDQVLKYHQMLRKALAKTEKDEEVQVRQRAKGRDIIFIVPKKQPSFVLAKSEFSVKSLDRGQKNLVTQIYELSLRDINSSPKLYGKPTSVDFKSEFKNAVIGGAEVQLFWDYTKEIPVDKYKADVKKIAAKSWPMGVPQYFPLRLSSGLANAATEFHFVGDDMKWLTKVQFSDVLWDFDNAPKQSIFFDLLRDVFSKIKNFHLDLELKSVGEKLDFNVKTDFDSAIQSALTAAIDKKLDEFKARLKLEIENRISQVKTQAMNSVTQYKEEVEKRAQNYLAQLTNYENETMKLEDQLKKRSQNAVQDKIKEGIKDIQKGDNPLKKMKLPF